VCGAEAMPRKKHGSFPFPAIRVPVDELIGSFGPRDRGFSELFRPGAGDAYKNESYSSDLDCTPSRNRLEPGNFRRSVSQSPLVKARTSRLSRASAHYGSNAPRASFPLPPPGPPSCIAQPRSRGCAFTPPPRCRFLMQA